DLAPGDPVPRVLQRGARRGRGGHRHRRARHAPPSAARHGPGRHEGRPRALARPPRPGPPGRSHRRRVRAIRIRLHRTPIDTHQETRRRRRRRRTPLIRSRHHTRPGRDRRTDRETEHPPVATFLYRLGRGSFRLRWLVLAVWVLIVGGVGVAATALQQETNPEFVLPGTESQEAFDLLEERFPEMSADGATASVVFQADEGETVLDEPNAAVIEALAATLESSPQIKSVTSPFAVDAEGEPVGMISPEDQSIAVMQVAYTDPAMELEDETVEYLEDAIADAAGQGLRLEVGGDVLQAIPEVGSTEIIGIAVALLVLVITFGALIAAGLPIVTAVLGVALTTSAIAAATAFMNVSESTGMLATMIGLAVGIDYALFILSRYRNELAVLAAIENRDTRAEAMGRAVGTAGSAVFFAGLTVIVALVGLSVVNIPFLTEMAVAAAITVLIAVIIAVTL